MSSPPSSPCGPASGRDASAFGSRLDRAADSYLVRRGKGRTIVAGYPWFTDWGRDTFIALRGLCLATGRLAEAGEILREWAGLVSDGMLPNLFPDAGGEPEFNSVDASLWYVVAVARLSRGDAGAPAGPSLARRRAKLQDAVAAILDGYAARHPLRDPRRRGRASRRRRSRACS